jgi:hypothetical protein
MEGGAAVRTRPGGPIIRAMPRTKPSKLKRPRNPMPYFVRSALVKRGLLTAYQGRPPYQRNDYLGWIARAKLDATKQKRLRQMLDELEGGERYMNMRWSPGAASLKRG